jgi:adenosylhomocysteine nucleosidase
VNMGSIDGLVMATYLEAQPFVKGLGLMRIEKRPFRIYSNGSLFLVLSGIGKANAAMATSYVIWKFGCQRIINAGAAGSTGQLCDIGDIYHIEKVIEYDRPKMPFGGKRIFIPDALPGFNPATLATQDRPVLALSRRKKISPFAELVDMEGASVVYASRLFQARCYLFKIVSDTVEHTSGVDILFNIKRFRKKLFEFFCEDVFPLLKG